MIETAQPTERRAPRIDGIERVTGRAKYAADWRQDGMLYGKPIFSTVAHGTVSKVDSSGALALKGVRAVITCKDIDILWVTGDRFRKRRLFADYVRFVGDCIGAVAADSRELAERGAEMVQVEYQELPAVFTVEDALKPGAPKVWPEGNLLRVLEQSSGELEAGFREADIILEDRYLTSRFHGSPMEPGASLAWWEDGKVTIVAGTQAISTTKQSLAANLGLFPEDVRIICHYKGGGFGNKNVGLNYDLMAAILARRAGKPVMIEYSRRDDFVGVHSRWSTDQRYRVGVKKDGTITAIHCKAYANIGAYARNPIDNFINGPQFYYECNNLKVESYPVYTNTPASGNMRAPADVPGCFPLESIMDQIANELRIDPVQFRLMNHSRKYEGEEDYTSNGLEECIRLGAKLIGWNENWHRPGDGPLYNGSKKHGIGMAIASFHSDPGPGEAVVTIDRDGTVNLAVGVTDIGTGAKSTMCIIAASTLGVPLDRIKLTWGDTGSCPFSIGESGSRTTTHTGYAVRQAAEEAKRKLLEHAGVTLGAPKEMLAIRDGFITSSSNATLKVSLEDVTRTLSAPLVGKVRSQPKLPKGYARFSFGAHFAEVAVDVEVGKVDILRYIAVHDSGKIVNFLTAESQIQGGVCMGLSMALSEELIIDGEFGMISNPSLWTYRILTQLGMPKVEVYFVETDDPFGPKSLGEMGIIPAPPTIGNAIYNATGARMRQIPMTPERILRELDRIPE